MITLFVPGLQLYYCGSSSSSSSRSCQSRISRKVQKCLAFRIDGSIERLLGVKERKLGGSINAIEGNLVVFIVISLFETKKDKWKKKSCEIISSLFRWIEKVVL